MTEISNVPFCFAVHVDPASVDDWEILVSIGECYIIIRNCAAGLVET